MDKSALSKPEKIQFRDEQIIAGLKESKNITQTRILESQFYERYRGYIYRVAINKCQNFSDGESLAKDITQATFINAFKAIKKFSFPAEAPATEYGNILKAWLGKIGNNCFFKIYASRKGEISIEDDSTDIDSVFCPICTELLIVEERKGMLVCLKGHYKTARIVKIVAKQLPEDLYTVDVFETLYGEEEIEVPNEFRNKLQEIMNTIKEEHRHILLTYVAEGCINSTQHLSEAAMDNLCKTFDTSPENIRQIKKRTLDKIKKHCFSTN